MRHIGVSLEPARVARWLVGILLLLLLAHAVGLIMHYGFGHDYVFGLVPLFSIALEGNVPTFYSSALFTIGGALFLLLSWFGSGDHKEGRIWFLLALVFFFLAVDEFAIIHERLIKPVREALGTGGLLYFAWIIPYLVAVFALAVLVGPTLWRLGGRFRLLFGLSAGLFLAGAVGVEMLGGRHYEARSGDVDLTYRLYQTVEECLEFSGLILLVYTQLALLQARAPLALLRIDFRKSVAARAANVPAQRRGRPAIRVVDSKG